MDLQAFCNKVKADTLIVQEAHGKKAEQLQIELSQFIGTQTQDLLTQGYSINDIQIALRSALDISSDIPDNEPLIYKNNKEDDYSEEEMELPVHEISCFIPVSTQLIQDLNNNEISEESFIEALNNNEQIMSFPDSILYVIEEIIRNIIPTMDDSIIAGGEIITTSDGEAIIPQTLQITANNNQEFLICDPMIYKTTDEVIAIYNSLQAIDEKQFKKHTKIKKLIKLEYFYQYDKKKIMKEKNVFIQDFWITFTKLRDLYHDAASENKNLIIFVVYD